MHSVTNSNTFLAYYNQIDKYFAYVLGLTKHLPFVEKVNELMTSSLPISGFVRHHQQQLKYFGDMRNQLVHGYRLDQHHYLIASDHAVKQIERVHRELQHPTQLVNLTEKKVIVVQQEQPLQVVIDQFVAQDGLQYVAIVDEKEKLSAVLSRGMLLGVEPKQAIQPTQIFIDAHREHLPSWTIGAQKMTIYEIESAFCPDASRMYELVILTEDGTDDSAIVHLLSVYELPMLLRATVS